MGNVNGTLEDGPALFLRDQSRPSLVVTNAQKRVILRIAPSSFPCSRIVAKKDPGDDSLVEFVQDPDPNAQSPFLLKLTNEDDLTFNFTFNIRRKDDATGSNGPGTNINGLTFIVASNTRDLENLVTREFHADPNLHKNPNVNLVGDFSTDGSKAVQFEWQWRWRPPQGMEDREDRKNMGWRNACSFVEYDQRAHKLSTLAQFSFWVQNTSRVWPPSPGPSSDYSLSSPPKMRSSSGYSPESKPADLSAEAEPPSPLVEAFDGSTLAPSIANAPSVKVDNCPRPVDSTMAEDGPLFRATIKSLEQKTGTLRTKMKKVLKRAEQARQAQIVCNDAVSAFMESLRDAASTGNASGIRPALDHYFERTYREILYFERQNETSLQELIIGPLTKLYNLDIKQAEVKKKDFEDESRDYYNYVSRYLGIRNDSAKEKKKIESETKYQTKRKNFELKRFDYSTFMQDLHGGRKEQEVLSQLTKFADAQARSYLATAKKVQELMPQLEALSYEVKESDKEFQLQRTEREERRRVLEKSSKTYVEPDNLPSFMPPPTPSPTSAPPSEILGHNTGFEKLGVGTSSIRTVSSGSNSGGDRRTERAPETVLSLPPNGLGLSSGSTRLTASEPSLVSTAADKFKGFRDLQEKEYTGNGLVNGESDRRKEGLLWALSRPGSHADPKGLNKQAWHKYWVVLAGGQLCEYSNWKQKLDLHNDPINLKMASVREARGAERRFCFEIVTPQYKRVYQATSEEDMNNWISAINNAVKSTIEGGGSVRNFDTSYVENDAGHDKLKNITTALTGKSPHYHHSVHGTNPMSHGSASNANMNRRTTVGARPTNVRRDSSNFNEDPEKLLQMVREADPTNNYCADCQSQMKTEWVSINLGAVLCIECSGLHRSLGTHISKVRSLTLDVTSFTPDLVELLCQVGNKNSNAIWEAKFDAAHRPDPRSSREQRLKFITSKYVDRAFVQPLSSTLSQYASPDESILAAVKINDLQGTLYALALHGSPNTVDPATGLHVVFLALRAADPVPNVPDNELVAPSANLSSLTFPLAELLIQNGGEIASNIPSSGLSLAAKHYLSQKTAKRSSAPAETAPSNATASSKHGHQPSSGEFYDPPATLRERQQREKEHLQKRVSSGGRLHRAPQLER
ncbi:ArfGap-domain-containing protein [Tuber magnatum]|uniref:ADP-ribosylation factor GTPase-activating protein n=1 Tax=Tuber magnatum TaxID=42249 RepID=A0A317SCI7_9PEZI|nr:ArfGap-domain-containing protein [Tuber magnatum]